MADELGGDKHSTSTDPSNWWHCHKCGNKIYAWMRHDCPTTQMIATRSPYDLNGLKEFPGD